MGRIVTLALATLVGVAVAMVTSVSLAQSASPDNAVARFLESHQATQPDVLDYGTR